MSGTRDLGDLPYDRVPAGAVALLPVGSTEAHGPHLPLGTDVVLALGAARRAAARLEAAGTPALVLPPLCYGVTEFAGGFAGSLGIQPETLELLVRELCERALARHAAVTVVNCHLEPDHVEALRRATDGLARVAFPDIRRRRLAERLGDEFRSGACHGGRFETSLVLACAPALVGARALPAVPISLSDAIRAGARSFAAAGLERAYCGDPAAASAAEGEHLLDALAEILVEATRAALAPAPAAG